MSVKTKHRRQKVTVLDIGGIFTVHNGKSYIKVKASLLMVGHRFGEFATTRRMK